MYYYNHPSLMQPRRLGSDRISLATPPSQLPCPPEKTPSAWDSEARLAEGDLGLPVKDPGLRAWHAALRFSPHTTLEERFCHAHLVDEAAEGQRGGVANLSSHS